MMPSVFCIKSSERIIKIYSQNTFSATSTVARKIFSGYFSVRDGNFLEKFKIVTISFREILKRTPQWMSLREIRNGPTVAGERSTKTLARARATKVSRHILIDDCVITPPERPHRPWLVPGVGRL
jgi:hypothetical protein